MDPLPPIQSPPGTSSFLVPPPGLHSSATSFPIIAIAIIGILATAFLLVSYYIFVIKCCLNWHRIDILHRFSASRNRNQDDPLIAYSPGRISTTRGLDESVIRAIPIFKFKKEGSNNNKKKKEAKDLGFGERSFCECAVCLNEFQEDERLRIIPHCSHLFHIDCIDVWLQNNANCPLCRTSISGAPRLFPFDHIVAPSSSPQDPTSNLPRNPCASEGSFAGQVDDDDEYVVIELGEYSNGRGNSFTDRTLAAAQERLNPGELPAVAARSRVGPSSPSKLERRVGDKKMGKRLSKVGSMGDECIDIRGPDDEFAIQPIRRSFSMDSSTDRQLLLAVQEIVQQRRQGIQVASVEGTSSGSRSRRNFFSLGHGGRGSRSSVLPVYFEPS